MKIKTMASQTATGFACNSSVQAKRISTQIIQDIVVVIATGGGIISANDASTVAPGL